MSKVKVGISPEEREFLLWMVGLRAGRLEAFEDAIDRGDRTAALELRDDLHFTMEMRDTLGWEDECPGEIELDLDVVFPWLRERQDEIYASLGNYVVSLDRHERALRGEEADDPILGTFTPEMIRDDMKIDEQNIVGEKKEAIVCDRLLRRLRDLREPAVA